jgi:hypothetical protein
VRDVGCEARIAGEAIKSAQFGADDTVIEEFRNFQSQMAVPMLITREGNERDAAVLDMPFSTYVRKDASVAFLKTVLEDENFRGYFAQKKAQRPAESSLSESDDPEESFHERIAVIQAKVLGSSWRPGDILTLTSGDWGDTRNLSAVLGLASEVWGVSSVPTAVAVVLHRMCQVAEEAGKLDVLLKAFGEKEFDEGC